MHAGPDQVTVGLWLDSWIQPAWRVRALRLLLERADVRVTYVAVVDPTIPAGPTLNGLLRLFLRRDHQRAIRFCPDAFAREDVRALFTATPAAPANVDVL